MADKLKYQTVLCEHRLIKINCLVNHSNELSKVNFYIFIVKFKLAIKMKFPELELKSRHAYLPAQEKFPSFLYPTWQSQRCLL